MTPGILWLSAGNLQVVPHVAQNEGLRGGSAIDRRAARHAGYAVSQRKRIEERFRWMKTIGLLRKLRHLSEALQLEYSRNVTVFIFLPAR